jgi:hypothetical protein
LHDYWFRDEYAGVEDEYHRRTFPPPTEADSRALRRQVERARKLRLLIEEFGQARVTKATELKSELTLQAWKDIEQQITRRDLRGFIEGAHFRATLTPVVKSKR